MTAAKLEGTAEAPSPGRAVDRPPLLARLFSWLWEEEALPDGAATLRDAAPQRPRGRDRPRQTTHLDRLTVAQWLWGEGFVMPGDAQYVLDLVKPFGLNPAMSMLDLSAGLGGPARAIAQGFGTYVTGLERSAERAQRGMAMSVAANLAKRATVSHYDPETLELRPNSFDCILGRGASYNVAEKEHFLRALVHGLKERGQFLLTEFTVNPKVGPRPELDAWAARESRPPHLWTVEQYTDCLGRYGVDIRVVEDISQSYQSMIVAGWARMIEEIDIKSMAKSHKLTIIDEAELWTKRLAALQCGTLQAYRIYALVRRAPH